MLKVAAEAISDDEVSVLYENNILRISSAEALINTIWLMNSIHFGLRGCDEHCQMCWSETSEGCRRNRIFRTLRVKPKQEAVKSLGTLDQLNLKLSQGRTAHPKNFPVFGYKFYSEKRPNSMQTVEAPYYLGISHSKDSSKC